MPVALPDDAWLFALLPLDTLLLPAGGVTGGWGGTKMSRIVTGRKLAIKPAGKCGLSMDDV